MSDLPNISPRFTSDDFAEPVDRRIVRLLDRLSRHKVRTSFSQLVLLVAESLSDRYRGTALGLFWLVMTPLLQAIGWWLVLGRRMELAFLPLILNVNAYHFFFSSVMNSCNSIRSRFDVLEHVEVHPRTFVKTEALCSAIPLTITLAFVLVALVVLHPVQLLAAAPAAIFALLALFGITIGASLIVGALGCFFKDIAHAVQSCGFLLYIASPILWTRTTAGEAISKPVLWIILHINPVAAPMEIVHSICKHRPVDAYLFVIAGVWATFLWFAGRACVEKLSPLYVEAVSR